MRILIVLVLAVAVGGCATIRRKTKSVGEGLPEAWHPHEHSKVDDSHREVLHSNDPARDKY
jgi:hypothetical protein